MEDHYDLIIEGGSILTMDPKSPLIKNGIIGIKGSRIAQGSLPALLRKLRQSWTGMSPSGLREK